MNLFLWVSAGLLGAVVLGMVVKRETCSVKNAALGRCESGAGVAMAAAAYIGWSFLVMGVMTELIVR